ncbi:AzlC family ABC transporter permease [Bacillus luteolus]|uniref:AzlC family ABC transporter permease n=1 Tax=Litchfieldia luteola TaxID=682179 RepID=A0ABR9QDY7_9BACI|nr:AzlC family ABC transporter permease [Cytobacillus luteolus]MBE4906711.1 AzlC family ABC transporter permease [Cytobacillus luteolus]MBP1940640.1 4-azaleucine resistance transporter AzlC [Cytobacillus luteolus]
MSTTILAKKHSDFREGVQAGVSIGLGYMPIALTFGLIAKSTGLSVSETILMSLLVFAGASQYIALSLLAVGTGVFEIILTTFIVNIRHLLMSASLNEKVEDDHPGKKALYAFGVTDETFSVSAIKEGTVSTGYMFGVIIIAYSSWVINSGIGHVIGSSLPQTLQESMSVALYAMFVGLLVPSMKKHKKVIVLAGAAAICNTLFSQFLSTGWAIVLATLVAAVVVEFFAKSPKQEEEISG